ncbi:MAG TPA: condensation domain-containing protein, partial [Gemmatimonadaceae bacterium]|nr:condensation domain-containing protein [Gemmatimonadaceae bacterium]
MSAGNAGQQQAGDTSEVEFDPFAGPAIQEAFASTEPQREIWTATRIGEDASLAFNESISLRLTGPLDRRALIEAIRGLVERHEALRSSFSEDGTSVLVHETPEIDLAIHEFGGLDREVAQKELAEILHRAVTEPFDLASPSLTRFELVALGPEQNILVMTAHHIVCDGWSFGVIAGDLAALYSAYRNGRVPELPPADRFSDYARTLYTDDSPELAAAEKYWLKQFETSIPILDLPADRTRPARKTYSADREDYVLSAELLRRVRDTGKKKGASLFATLLAGFGTLLHRLSGQDDIIVGIPVAGQASTGFPGLVGHCVNMLPLRLHPTPDLKFSEMLGKARTTMLDALDNQQMTL